jgi:hypothetical protein
MPQNSIKKTTAQHKPVPVDSKPVDQRKIYAASRIRIAAEHPRGTGTFALFTAPAAPASAARCIGRKDMPAYWLARAKINDPVKYKKYPDKVPEILARYEGRVRARGWRFWILEGSTACHRFVVVRISEPGKRTHHR